MHRICLVLLLAMSAAGAQVAGPPKPEPPVKPASQEAIDRIRAQALRGAPRRCRQGPGGEIVVCGSNDGSSPYRLPLPTERQRASNEPGRASIGGSPVSRTPATGMTFTLKPGLKTKLKGNGTSGDDSGYVPAGNSSD